jgi:hypothetical protein
MAVAINKKVTAVIWVFIQQPDENIVDILQQTAASIFHRRQLTRHFSAGTLLERCMPEQLAFCDCLKPFFRVPTMAPYGNFVNKWRSFLLHALSLNSISSIAAASESCRCD